MSILDWYSTSHWGDRFGAPRANGRTHLGTDIQHPGRTWVPALRGGTIIAVNRSSVLGNVISIKPDDYAPGRGYEPQHYAHLWGAATTLEQRRAELVGRQIRTGEGFAQLAAVGDVTGTAWSGPHLHFTAGPIEAWYGINVRNSDDVILSALADFRTAGGGPVVPITPDPKDWFDMATEQQLENIVAAKTGPLLAALTDLKLRTLPRAVRNTQTGAIALIEPLEGLFYQFSSVAEMETWIAMEKLRPGDPVNATPATFNGLKAAALAIAQTN